MILYLYSNKREQYFKHSREGPRKELDCEGTYGQDLTGCQRWSEIQGRCSHPGGPWILRKHQRRNSFEDDYGGSGTYLSGVISYVSA